MRRWLLASAAALVAVLVPTVTSADPSPGTTRRLADSEHIPTAAADLSRGTWADGTAEVVVLARDDVFADALAGASLAGTSGPILFTDRDALDGVTAAEIDRVLAIDGCVLILGGTGAVDQAVEDELRAGGDGRCVERIAGATRIETALAIAGRVPDVGTVLLARADAWYDAVAAGAHAAHSGAPILVTPSDRLDPAVADHLEATDPSEIVLLGGTGALSSAVEQAARAIASTRRVAGTTRDTTAIAIAEELWTEDDRAGVTLVNGHAATGWAYAIAASVTAALEGAPVLFTQASARSAATVAFIDRADPSFTITAGPPRLIRPGVAHGHSPTADLHRIAPPASSPARYRSQVFDDVTVTSGVTYGTARNRSGQQVTLQLDLYEPTGDTNTARPLIVWIHGGGFSSGSRTSPEIVDQATVFAKQGYVAASISYRLEPGGCSAGGATAECIEAIREAHEDARTAIAFLRQRAGQHRIDTDRVAVGGSSAGGITALNVAYTSSEAEDPDHVVQAAVSISGAGLMGPISPGDAAALDFHGDPDYLVPYDWAVGTIRQASEQGLLAKLTTWPGAGHVPYREHRQEILDQTNRFLWWALAIDGADTST